MAFPGGSTHAAPERRSGCDLTESNLMLKQSLNERPAARMGAGWEPALQRMDQVFQAEIAKLRQNFGALQKQHYPDGHLVVLKRSGE